MSALMHRTATPSPAASLARAARPATAASVDHLLIGKIARARELLAMGATDSAQAMLSHVLDLAEGQDPLLYVTAQRLMAQAS